MRLVILLIGCAGSPPPPPHTTALELLDGSGAPYRDGQEVTLVAGAQGGYHVWLGYRMTPPPAGELQIERTAHRVSDDALVLRFQTTLEADGMPLPMFMCPVPVGLPVLDRPIRYELHFSDEKGPVAEGAITLVPHCPEDSIDVCQRICSG